MKILLLSVPTGQGHHQAAKALNDYFEQLGNVECRVLDLFENVNPILADSMQKGYLMATKVTPKVYGTFYDIADKRDYSKYSNVGRIIKNILNHDLMKYLKVYKPDVVICTHVFAAIAISYLKRKYPFKATTVSILTDFTVHPYWEDVDTDYYITASELLEFQANKKGCLSEKIKPFGIPILPKFSENTPKDEMRKKLGFENKFTVLVMMGSMGYGSDTVSALKKLDDMSEDFQIVLVCGNNKKMKKYVDKMQTRKKFITYGFTNNVDELMGASDCIITKPGGLSTSEALAKQIPMILLDPIPGQEDRNKEFMLNSGIAMSISETFSVDEAIFQLLKFEYKRDILINNMKYIRKPESTKNICEFILSLHKEK